jgi:hypothetical protein
MAKKTDCITPDFSNISGTDVENTTMIMVFNAGRINDLTGQLYIAVGNMSDNIATERVCYIRKLKKNIEELESKIRYIP